MSKSIYALLVGIDEYDPTSIMTIPSLEGCVNDIKAVEAYLRGRVTKDSEWKLIDNSDRPWVLTNQQATREAVIQGFEQHLCQAESDDVVLFYYAGHGAQEKAPQEFLKIEADGLDETIVCYNSRTQASRDLADKELSYLISKVAQKNPHIVIVLDCCHSGSGTRDVSSEFKVRRSPVDSRERSLNNFIFANDLSALDEILNSAKSMEQKTTSLVLPTGKHVILSACRDYELAKEYLGDNGEPRGVFSYFLLNTLQSTNGNISYKDLVRNINAIIGGKVKEQSPQVDATDRTELDKAFLGGAISASPTHFNLTYNDKDNSWIIDGGGIFGVPVGANGSDTILAIFPAGSTAEQLRELSEALATVKVTQVLPQKSKVQIISGSDKLSQDDTYYAVVISLPLPPLKVYFKGEAAELKLVQQALQTVALGGKPSLYVCQVNDAKEADYQVIVKNGQYWITQPQDDRPVVAPIPEDSNQTGDSNDTALQVIYRLEHIARWHNILELRTPPTSRIKTDDVQMEIIQSGQENSKSGSEMRLEYTYENGEWISPTLQIKLTNNSDKTLFCNVLDLSESFAVDVPFFEVKSSVRLSPKGTITSDDNLSFIIPDTYIAQGTTEYKDVFKLIVSSTDFHADFLEQDGLKPPETQRDMGDYPGTLDRLMIGVNSREAVRATGNNDDWMTKEVTITIVRSPNAYPIQHSNSTFLQNDLVEVQSHSELQAQVNLTSVPQASRDLRNLILPAILRQQPYATESFQFTTSRGSDPGLSVLELSNVQNYQVVTKENPLKLVVNQSLADNEHLIPFAYDGEFFLPLGQGLKTADSKTEITLERLTEPIPLSINSRSLQNSIKIFFEKVVSDVIRRPFAYPILAVANVDDQDKVTYEAEHQKVTAQVAQAEKIVLYIHGIIGDTESMIPSIKHATVEVNGQQRPLRDTYDLVLAFDYENLNTKIQENAKLLGERLQAVGLGPNHGKQLHIVAHSMGGLVSRWFIEREGGNKVVQHLVMLGTPNGGSPWPKLQDLVFTVLCLGLNQLSAIVWPTKIVAGLVKFLEVNDYSLDEMQPGSNFLKELAKNPDPGVRYTIISGDRSISKGAMEVQPEKQQTSPLQRLLKKAFGSAVDKVVDLAFFKQPNDIAVTLTSIKNVSDQRTPQPKILLPDIACDHLSYFTTKAGLEALAMALKLEV
ncbi:MAG: caspase family protein [Rhizonema sp. NSF051]|nr:caspase family protein [Rhizonema sp. NSF051]